MLVSSSGYCGYTTYLLAVILCASVLCGGEGKTKQNRGAALSQVTESVTAGGDQTDSVTAVYRRTVLLYGCST